MDIFTRDYINELTQRIIIAYNIKIPITNIENIVHQMGGVLEEKFNFDDLYDGTIKKTGNTSFYIAISPFQSEQRKAFTIAHELGHLFLHMGFQINPFLWERQNETIYKRFGASEQEYQANEFAASLLMPKELYRDILNKSLDGNRVNISKVADFFNVSITAATNRGRFLGYLS